MQIINKLVTIVRGGVRESAEVVIDANGLRIFEQEIHDCETAIHQSKQHLSLIVAEKIRLQRDVKELALQIDEREKQAVKALEQDDQDLAREIAGLIVEKERILKLETNSMEKLNGQEKSLKKALRTSVRQLNDYRRELRMVKATDSAHKATSKIAVDTVNVGSRMMDMQSTLERIRNSQQEMADQFIAVQEVNSELSEQSLEEKISKAGIDSNFGKENEDDVLDRLRNKMKK